ncbi:hypothetical protein QVZ41_12100 [Wenyingzhuangia sp. chi5]|uniref:Uncharacterized protein n=1 Tax=Wenyingzhuangia gilva TaxID=3057677 RepID=A0ABT8VUD4_9FLAO|nr:hypothetical protein [Wenyingzhuangia sp. chi5]MDO3695583.1 hypothetical protein [Wenyingzhuangia sp. chi5]
MVELQKQVLSQVVNHKNLFIKELMKSKKWLTPPEIVELKNWLSQEQFKEYHTIIEATLNNYKYQLAS